MRTVLVGFLSALMVTCGLLVPQGTPIAMRHSCGYHCTLDGSAATTAAPVVTAEIQLAGRANIHSDSRAAGKAMPRVGSPVGRGIGGHAIHKVDYYHKVDYKTGRTNIHSGGRLHGSANKRVGCGGCSGHPASASIGNSVWLLN